MAFQPKGTGAIDLAAGSSGVNISNGNTVTAITRTAGGSGYATAPTVAISAPTTAGGVQATATCTVTAGAVDTTFTITNAGSGYIEQPTITFSGGGGSGAAAFANVGGTARVTAISSVMELATSSGVGFRIANSGVTNVNFLSAQGNSSGGTAAIYGIGADTDVSVGMGAKAAGNVRFFTNTSVEQMRVSHTASAVNYVQVTGASTTGFPVISGQGSDGNVGLILQTKGSSYVRVSTGGSANNDQLRVNHTASAVNYFGLTGAAAGSAPALSVAGTDTDIDLALTPKGTGNVRFGTYTAGVLTPTGYVTIKTSDGTTRRLLVG
jgi:hypothetical protein